MSTRQIGQITEQIACDFLQAQGCKIREHNFRCQMGEIDLVMDDGDCLVFVEVRYRGKEDFGSGAATVSQTKQNKIIRAAKFFLQKHAINHTVYCRFDVVSITVDKENPKNHKIDWIKDAFQVKSAF